MKRLISLIMVVVMLLSIVPMASFAAEDATCTEGLGHTAAEAVRENEVAATCKTEGSYDSVVYCKECGEKLSSTKETIPVDANNHKSTETELKNTKAATCTEDGYTGDECYKCCGAVKTAGSATDKSGHDFTEKVIDEDHLKSAATCKAYAVYYYDCSRCDVIATDSDTNPTFEDTDAGYAAHKFDAQSTDAKYLASEATCTAKATYYYSCSVCGAKGTETFESGELAVHNYVWKTDTDATCGKGGTKHKECSVCGYENGETDAIPATGAHNYTDVVTDPTCIAQGYTTHTCSVCGYIFVDAFVKKLDHNWAEDFTVDKEATCTETGSKSKHCSGCSEKIEVTEIPAKGHTEASADNVVAATCTTDGKESDTICSVCGETLAVGATIKATGHNWKETVKTEATCTADGLISYVCENDSTHTKTETIEAKGHTAGTWITDMDSNCVNGGTKHQVCSVCGETIAIEAIPAKGHSYKDTVTAPTCIAQGYTTHTCSVCGYIFVDAFVKKLDHDWAEDFTVDKEATCTETGLKSKHCSGCSEKSEVTEIPAKGHTQVIDAAVEPTCTATGLTKGKHCSACNTVLVTQKVVPAKGHGYGKWIINKKPTCTADGVMHKVCSVCNDRVDETIDKLGHDWAKDFTVDKEATCTEAGSKSKHCSRCSEKSKDTEIPATGHTLRKKNAKAATCTKGGYNTFWCCTVCKAYFTDAAGKNETTAEALKTAATGHKLQKTDAKAATCTQTGNKAYWTCTVCKKVFADAEGKTATTLAALTIAATGHKLKETEKREATCTRDGHEAYWTCKVCKKIYADEDCEKETTLADLKISATRHVNKTQIRKAATCKNAGYVVTVCEDCGCFLSVDSYTTKVVHKYGTPPKWSWSGENATATITCSLCGEKTPVQNVKVTKKISKKATTSQNGSVVCTATAVTGGKTYTNTKSITVYKISSAVLSASSYSYDGKAKTPSVIVKDSMGKTLKNKVDYDVTYSSGRINPGTYNVKITYKGNYYGSKTLTFKINYTIVEKGCKLSWVKLPGATKYNVYTRKSSKDKYSVISTSKTYITFECGQYYSVYVVAKNKSGKTLATSLVKTVAAKQHVWEDMNAYCTVCRKMDKAEKFTDAHLTKELFKVGDPYGDTKLIFDVEGEGRVNGKPHKYQLSTSQEPQGFSTKTPGEKSIKFVYYDNVECFYRVEE